MFATVFIFYNLAKLCQCQSNSQSTSTFFFSHVLIWKTRQNMKEETKWRPRGKKEKKQTWRLQQRLVVHTPVQRVAFVNFFYEKVSRLRCWTILVQSFNAFATLSNLLYTYHCTHTYNKKFLLSVQSLSYERAEQGYRISLYFQLIFTKSYHTFFFFLATTSQYSNKNHYFLLMSNDKLFV